MAPCLNLIVRGATNLNLDSQGRHLSVVSKFKTPTFQVVAAFTDGDGQPTTSHKKDSKEWDAKTKTSWVKSSGTPLSHGKKDGSGHCSWGETLRLPYPDPEQLSPDATHVTLCLRRDYGTLYSSHEVARTRMTLQEMAVMDPHGEEGMELFVFEEESGELVSAGEEARPTMLRVSVDRDTLPDGVAAGEVGADSQGGAYAKRLMIVTRGTRGDIQVNAHLSRLWMKSLVVRLNSIQRTFYSDPALRCALPRPRHPPELGRHHRY